MSDKLQIVRFGDVARTVRNIVDPETSGLERYVAGEHMDTDDLRIRRWGTIGDGYLGPAFHMKFEAGQILYGSRRTYLRKVAVADFDGICANTTFVIEAIPERIVPELLPFIMQSEPFTEHSILRSRGSTNPYVTWSDIACYEFALLPLDEQRRIADILWAAEETSESYLNLTMQILEFKRTLWLEAVFRKDWPRVKLGEIAHISNGTTPSRKVERYWSGGNIPWLPTGKVHERIIQNADEYVTEDALAECSLRLMPKESVLIAMIGQGKTRGSVAYLAIDACINQNFACVIPSDQIDNWYLFHCLDNLYDELRRFSHGSNQGSLSCRLLEQFSIPFPPLELQYQLAEKFNKLERQNDATLQHIAVLRKLKLMLLASLLPQTQSELAHV